MVRRRGIGNTGLWVHGRRHFADEGAGGGAAGSGGGAAAAAGAGAGAGSGGGQAGTGFVNADGTFADGWLTHASLPAEARTDKTLAGMKTVADLVRHDFNLNKVIGEKRLVVPKGPQDKEAYAAAFAALGAVDSPDKLPKLELPEGVTADESDKALREWAVKHHLTGAQYLGLANEILAWNVADHKAAQAKAATRAQELQAAEKTAWGAQYEFNAQLVDSVAAGFLPAERLEKLRSSGALANPEVRELLVQIGQVIDPDRLHVNTRGGVDPVGIERQIRELETSEPYRKADHPQHNDVTNRVLQLRNQLISAQQGQKK